MRDFTRREVLRGSLTVAGVLGPLHRHDWAAARQPKRTIRFGVIGLNHPHIYTQTETVRRSGGELAAFYAAEPDLAQAFSKRFPDARVARTARDPVGRC